MDWEKNLNTMCMLLVTHYFTFPDACYVCSSKRSSLITFQVSVLCWTRIFMSDLFFGWRMDRFETQKSKVVNLWSVLKTRPGGRKSEWNDCKFDTKHNTIVWLLFTTKPMEKEKVSLAHFFFFEVSSVSISNGEGIEKRKNKGDYWVKEWRNRGR